VSDRIAVTVGLPAEVRARIVSYEGFLAAETLATTVIWTDPDEAGELTLGEHTITVSVALTEGAG
jgi:hypothetical protein